MNNANPTEAAPRPAAQRTAVAAEAAAAAVAAVEATQAARSNAPASVPATQPQQARPAPASAPSSAPVPARPEPKPQVPTPSPPTAAAPKPDAVPEKPFTEALPEHVAGMVCYLFGWVSGLVFLVVDRRPFVRYHAAQSVVVYAALSLLLLLMSGFFLASIIPGAAMAGLLMIARHIVEIVWIASAIVLMLKASSGERYRVPYAADYADRAADAKG